RKRYEGVGCVTERDGARWIQRPHEPQGACKDYEFSRGTMNKRWEQGLSDARTTLAAAPWLAPIPDRVGVRVFDVMHDVLVGQATPTSGPHTAAQPMEQPPTPEPERKRA